MIKIFEKRGKWCYRNKDGRLFKFATEEEAKRSLGFVGLEIESNGGETQKDYETEDYEEEDDGEEEDTPPFI